MTGRQFIVFVIVAVVTTLVTVCLPVRPLQSAGPAGAGSQPIPPPIDPAEQTGARRLPHAPPRPGEVRNMAIKQLGNFDFEATRKIPDDVRRLSGMSVRLRGFMIIMSETEHIHQFDLVYSIGTCCFAGPPRVQHFVEAKVRDGSGVVYCTGKVEMTGTLHVGVQSDGDGIESIYRVDVDSLKPD